MSETIESNCLNIYNRIAPKFQIPRLSAKVDLFTLIDGSVTSNIVITSDDETLYVELSLAIPMGEESSENIDFYRWEYMDCFTGALYESDLDYNSTDEEVIAFFQHTLATDKFTNWRG